MVRCHIESETTWDGKCRRRVVGYRRTPSGVVVWFCAKHDQKASEVTEAGQPVGIPFYLAPRVR